MCVVSHREKVEIAYNFAWAGFHLEKWAREGQNNTYKKGGGGKGSTRNSVACLLGGSGDMLLLQPVHNINIVHVILLTRPFSSSVLIIEKLGLDF